MQRSHLGPSFCTLFVYSYISNRNWHRVPVTSDRAVYLYDTTTQCKFLQFSLIQFTALFLLTTTLYNYLYLQQELALIFQSNCLSGILYCSNSIFAINHRPSVQVPTIQLYSRVTLHSGRDTLDLYGLSYYLYYPDLATRGGGGGGLLMGGFYTVQPRARPVSAPIQLLATRNPL